MSDAIRKIEGVPLQPLTLSVELETGCFRAVPNNRILIDRLIEYLSLPEETKKQLQTKTRMLYERYYSWDRTAQIWMNHFDNIDIDKYERLWHSQPQYIDIPNSYPNNLNNTEFAKWLIVTLLKDYRFLNSHLESRLVHDLNYGVARPGISGMYFNESSMLFQDVNLQPFNRDIAFQHFVQLANHRNRWERARWSKIQQKK
jgi:hypothetical protein